MNSPSVSARLDGGRRLRSLSLAEQVFSASVTVFAVHLASVAVLGFRWGGPASPLLALLTLVLLPACLFLFIRGGRTVRMLLAAALGLGALAVGVGVYLPHILLGRAAGSDYTGVLATFAGLVVLGLAFRLILAGRRRLVGVIAIPLVLVVLVQWVFYPAAMAAMHVDAPRPDIPAASALGIRGAADVTFSARDGVRLAAWYVPGRNGAAVILLHGTGDSRLGTLEHLRMFAAAGYAVLAVDARGHGQSDGQPNSWGWRASDTVAGAVDFLRQQPGVDPARIAALGLSTGAIEALRAAAEGVPLAAVVADGPGPLTQGDLAATLPRLEDGWLVAIDLSANWVTMRLTTLFSGDAEPAPLIEMADQIRVPVLIIAANPAVDPGLGSPPGERVVAEAYRDRIGVNAALWYVDDVGHTQALYRHPQEYTTRVVAFLTAAMAPTRQPTHIPTSMGVAHEAVLCTRASGQP